ncbi:MAG TPA: GDSL-type esterase/lipase family protein [Candidatus Kryptonia bacterium]
MNHANRYLLPALVLSILSVSFVPGGPVDVFLIGDSTMADKPLADYPERGWGQMLPMFFNDSVTVRNYAHNGRSTRSFIDRGEWDEVYKQLHPGSYLFIQFGHNDEKRSDSTRYTDPETSFRGNLIRFVEGAREKGAVPVLITPVNRREYDKSNHIIETHLEYSRAVRSLATEENVFLIDLDSSSKALFDAVGPDSSKKIFLSVSKNEYKRLPDGKEDNTHFQQGGAIRIANLVVDAIRKSALPLSHDILSRDTVNSIIGGGVDKVVGLDCYHNNEWKTDKDGKEIRYHYIWEDEENSGYSELGGIITNLNARLSELATAPSAELLRHYSVFIIVDPDTPSETKDPKYIEPDQVKTITSWVESGGVLLLFANDKGNCEFFHLNQLAEQFGIHFNEDSRNDVVGQDYDTGKFDNLPDHPVFRGVHKIFLKEISTLTVQSPATPLLRDNGDVIMATSHVGKGLVFAVGDPWLYNEYLDNKKLPVGFENYKAARSLFRFLIERSMSIKEN